MAEIEITQADKDFVKQIDHELVGLTRDECRSLTERVATFRIAAEAAKDAQIAELEDALRRFLMAHDASALDPDNTELEAAEIDTIGDLRCLLAKLKELGHE